LRKKAQAIWGDEERQAVLDVCNDPEFASLPPSQIVPRLADRGVYLASEATVYRLLRATGQAEHRGRAKAPDRTIAQRAIWHTSARF